MSFENIEYLPNETNTDEPLIPPLPFDMIDILRDEEDNNDNEDDSPNIDRRLFLKIAMTTLGAIALGPINQSCSLLKKDFHNNILEIQKEELKRRNKFEDPHGFMKYLKKDEFILPRKVMDIFWDITCHKAQRDSFPAGIYLLKSEMGNKDNLKRFRRYMTNLGYNADDTSYYENILLQDDIILYLSDHFNNKKFFYIIEHERMHQAFKLLDSTDYQKLKEVEHKFTFLTLHQDIFPKRISQELTLMSMEEFYTYLNDGLWGEKVTTETENLLKNEYPEVYEIYKKIQNKYNINELREKYGKIWEINK